MNEVMSMRPTRRAQTELEWKRSYLRELEKKRQRQRVELAKSGADLAKVREEVAELERLLGDCPENSI